MGIALGLAREEGNLYLVLEPSRNGKTGGVRVLTVYLGRTATPMQNKALVQQKGASTILTLPATAEMSRSVRSTAHPNHQSNGCLDR